MSDQARKYCQDCRHCFVPPSGLHYARCFKAHSPANSDRFIAPEFDTRETNARYCASTREDARACGPDAAWFESAADHLAAICERTREELANGDGLEEEIAEDMFLESISGAEALR